MEMEAPFDGLLPADKTASGSKMIHSSDDLDDEAKCFSSSFFVGEGGGGLSGWRGA